LRKKVNFLKIFFDRLFLSGSSALPESIFQKWHELTGFEIVEQFGSSETGRVLSNKLDGKKLAGRE
jgi:malonyl-CoA/methylmalonyl-CoA synthetase